MWHITKAWKSNRIQKAYENIFVQMHNLNLIVNTRQCIATGETNFFATWQTFCCNFKREVMYIIRYENIGFGICFISVLLNDKLNWEGGMKSHMLQVWKKCKLISTWFQRMSKRVLVSKYILLFVKTERFRFLKLALFATCGIDCGSTT